MEDDILPSAWNLYSHAPNNDQWDMASYIPLYHIRTVDNFWTVMSLLKHEHISNGMFFFMKDGTEPRWEHPSNKNGGAWSIKIPSEQSSQAFIDMCVYALCEMLMNDDAYNNSVSGITISPKLKFSIIKVWNSDKSCSDITRFNPDLKWFKDTTGILYRPHES